MDYVHAEAAERGCPPDHRPAPRAAHSATAPFRPATPTPPGGHLSIAHPPRRRPAIVLIRAFHPQVARPSDPVHRTRRPGALSAAEDFRASHSIVGMTLERRHAPRARSRSASLSLNEYGMRYIADDRLGWIAVVPDVPNQRCICAGPYERRPSRKKQAIPLERLLPAQVLAGLRNAVTLFDTNDRHYHEPGPREGEEKAFGFTTDVMRRQALRVRPGRLILVGRV